MLTMKAESNYLRKKARTLFHTEAVVVVQIFNATGHLRHIEAAAIVMYMYLYSLAFMDHPCTLGAAVCHKCRPVHFILNPGHVEYVRRINGVKIV